ncbi:MAG TPA: hypothetical protein VIL20_05310 [Sandaracinaceae bacterium]
MTNVRATWLVRRALLAACLLAWVGCDGSGGHLGRLTFEVAASPSECSPSDQPGIGSDAPCTVVRVWRDGPGGRMAVPLFRADDDHSAGAQGSLELRFDEANVSFDTRLMEGPHDLEVAVYTGAPWAPTYGATVEDVDLQRAQLRVRLYPFGRWACPGWRVDGALAPRALHQAVVLDNGDVLLLGGVTGANIDPASADTTRTDRVGALLQPIVEVYEQDEHRFRQVTVTNGEFARVLFGAIYLGREGNRHRIRILGGLTMPEERAGSAVLGFDNAGILTELGAPFAPSPDAIAAPAVDLLYDETAYTIEIDDTPINVPTGRTVGAALVVSTPRHDGSRAILIGLAKVGAPSWLPTQEYYTMSGSPVEPRMLSHPRLGGTVDGIPLVSRFLVWGGNLSSTGRDTAVAGELLQPTGSAPSTLPIDSVASSLPPPTAFHSSTRVSDSTVVIAGGLLIDESGLVLAATPAPSDAIFALEVTSGLDVLRHGVAVPEGSPYAPTILHTATHVPGYGVVLTGGASPVGGDRFHPVATTVRVRGGPGTFALDALSDLQTARFGHAAALLPGHRLLVTGGLVRDETTTPATLRAIASPEIIYLGQPPHASILGGNCVDQPTLPDAGVDAGPPPLPDAGPMPDGGPPSMTDGEVMPPDGGAGP